MNNTNMDTTTKDKVARLAERLEGMGATRLQSLERESIHPLYADDPSTTECAGISIELRDAYEPEETALAAINLNGLEITEIPDGAPFRIDYHTLHDLAAFTTMFCIGYKACLAEVVHELKPTDTQKGGKQ